MATNVTYATALVSMRDFALSAGFDNSEVIEKVNKLIDQKSTTSARKGKTQARKDNESIARDLVNAMRDAGVTTIQNKWVRENFNSAFKPAKVTAILNVAVELGLLERDIVAKSASRNELYYNLV